MIPYGHQHEMTPVSKLTRAGDGALVVHSRCNAPVVVVDGWPRPTCTLEEERVFNENGVCVSFRFRFNSVWMDPLDLLRVLPVSVEECPDCRGRTLLAICGRCLGLGVVEDGTAVSMPELRVAS